MRELVCQQCGASFPSSVVITGKRRDLRERKHCLDCVPYRELTKPRRPVPHPVKMLTCEACGSTFPAKQVIDGKMRSLYRRRFCLNCSPFGIHNTSKSPPGTVEALALVELRRRRRNAKTYRYQKKRRKALKGELVAARGGRCFDCGYAGTLASLDFHHRDPADKEFAISRFGGAYRRLLAEVEKCDLVCANCHRIRHAIEDARIEPHPVVAWRRRTKQRAVEFMGSACQACGATGPVAIFDFHHRNASDKDFAISQDGVPRRWETIVAELAKCVMLCANCHREVHAGVRTLTDAPPVLAEEALEYAA